MPGRGWGCTAECAGLSCPFAHRTSQAGLSPGCVRGPGLSCAGHVREAPSARRPLRISLSSMEEEEAGMAAFRPRSGWRGSIHMGHFSVTQMGSRFRFPVIGSYRPMLHETKLAQFSPKFLSSVGHIPELIDSKCQSCCWKRPLKCLRWDHVTHTGMAPSTGDKSQRPAWGGDPRRGRRSDGIRLRCAGKDK